MWPLAQKLNSGFLRDGADFRDVWLDEIYAGDTGPLPESYRIEGLPFKDQFQNPFCGAMAVVTAAQHKYKQLDGKDYEFSQPHLFYQAGGTVQGSSTRPLLDVATKPGLIPYKDFPIKNDTTTFFKDRYAAERKAALDMPFRDAKKINGYARVICTEDRLRSAILTYGGLVTPVAAYGAYFADGASKRVNGEDNHLVYRHGWEKDRLLVHDSLAWKTNGDRWLDSSYQFASAYCLLDLPENWREIRDEARAKVAPNALEHYGQRRSLEREIEVANELLKQLKAFNNQSVLEAAGRFWTVLVNAIAYGGYSYRDCINDVYNWRRTGQHIFDFNYETRDNWANRIKQLKN